MYRIGLFSKINKITVKTLRYYDQVGLLKPAHVDGETGYRYYTSEQLPRLHKIIALRQIGFSIEEILAIVDNRNVEAIFYEKRDTLEQTIRDCHQQLSRITHYLTQIKEEFRMDYQVALKELSEVIVYSKRMTIPNYDHYFDIVPEIGKEIAKANPTMECTVPEYCFAIYHDGEFKDKDIDVEFCEAVTAYGRDTETIRFKKIDRVPEAACVYHKGPYNTIGKAYAFLLKWIADNGYTLADNPRESYIDGIWNKDDESEWLTELQIPLKKG